MSVQLHNKLRVGNKIVSLKKGKVEKKFSVRLRSLNQSRAELVVSQLNIKWALKFPEKDANILPTWKENLLIKNSRHDPIPFGSLCHLYFCLLWATQKEIPASFFLFVFSLFCRIMYVSGSSHRTVSHETWKKSEVEPSRQRTRILIYGKGNLFHVSFMRWKFKSLSSSRKPQTNCKKATREGENLPRIHFPYTAQHTTKKSHSL